MLIEGSELFTVYRDRILTNTKERTVPRTRCPINLTTSGPIPRK